LTKTETNQ